MNYTTIEQSKKLLELGLKPETADMSYGNFCVKGLGYCDQFRASLTPYTKEVEIYEENKKAYGIDKYDGVVAWEVLPCWSLNKLMELLPPSINHYDEADRCNTFEGTRPSCITSSVIMTSWSIPVPRTAINAAIAAKSSC